MENRNWSKLFCFKYQYECFLLSFKLSKLKKYIDLTEFVLNLSCSTDLVFLDTLYFIFTMDYYKRIKSFNQKIRNLYFPVVGDGLAATVVSTIFGTGPHYKNGNLKPSVD